MDIRKNVSLKDYTTMKVGGLAAEFAAFSSVDELRDLLAYANAQELKVHILGSGSNTIVSDDGFDGFVLKNEILGIEIKENTVTAGAGVVWDTLVQKATSLGLSGIEAMSAIPGTVGAAPVQNIGAYGQELANTLVSLQAIDTQAEDFDLVTLSKNDCGFTYRNSIFKSTEQNRYIICEVTLQLNTNSMEPPFYKSLQNYLDAQNIAETDPQTIRNAVIEVRKTRLPDPSVVANSGSFFQNPIITTEQYAELKQEYDDIPGFDAGDNKIKVSAGWLLEHAGFKNHDFGNFATFEHNALVLTHNGSGDAKELADIKEAIVNKIKVLYNIGLTQEPIYL